MNRMAPARKLPPIVDFDDKSFNPFKAEVLSFGDVLDPHSVLADMRRMGGDVHAGGLHQLFMKGSTFAALGDVRNFIVLGYDACFQAFTDPATFTNEILKKTAGLSFGRSLTTMDAPEHPQVRRIFQKAFLPHVVAKWGQDAVDPVIDSLVSKFEGRGSADLVEAFTHHFPFQIIYKQLGLDADSIPVFHRLAVSQTLTRNPAELPRAREANTKLGDFFRALIRQRLDDPGDDMVSVLAHAEADGERLSEEVVVSFFRQLMNAGGDTTYRGTSNLLTGLLSNPEQLEAVRADRGLIPQAIDEGLRWEPPVTTMIRSVTRDVEIGGVTIPQGSVADLVIMSANRDPAKFPQPQRFDIFRERHTRAIPFGTGPHVCIGQHLARLEITRALNALLDRLPNLRLDPDMPAPEIRGYVMRTPAHIHVRFD